MGNMTSSDHLDNFVRNFKLERKLPAKCNATFKLQGKPSEYEISFEVHFSGGYNSTREINFEAHLFKGFGIYKSNYSPKHQGFEFDEKSQALEITDKKEGHTFRLHNIEVVK